MKTHYFHFQDIDSLPLLVKRLMALITYTQSAYFLLDPDERGTKLSYDHWSPREIIGHLCDSARYNLMRFTEAQYVSAPYAMPVYNRVELVKILNYQNQDDSRLITFWAGLNHQLAMVLGHISADDLAKNVSTQDETTTLEYIIYDYVGHMQHHLEQIFGQLDAKFLA